MGEAIEKGEPGLGFSKFECFKIHPILYLLRTVLWNYVDDEEEDDDEFTEKKQKF